MITSRTFFLPCFRQGTPFKASRSGPGGQKVSLFRRRAFRIKKHPPEISSTLFSEHTLFLPCAGGGLFFPPRSTPPKEKKASFQEARPSLLLLTPDFDGLLLPLSVGPSHQSFPLNFGNTQATFFPFWGLCAGHGPREHKWLVFPPL